MADIWLAYSLPVYWGSEVYVTFRLLFDLGLMLRDAYLYFCEIKITWMAIWMGNIWCGNSPWDSGMAAGNCNISRPSHSPIALLGSIVVATG